MGLHHCNLLKHNVTAIAWCDAKSVDNVCNTDDDNNDDDDKNDYAIIIGSDLYLLMIMLHQ